MSAHPAAVAARAYFERVRARDPDGLAALCAVDAQVLLHDGRVFSGREGVRAAYADIFSRADPQPQLISTIAEGDACAAEFMARRPDGSTGRTVDVFRVDGDGLIVEMRVYMQSC